MVRGSCSCGGVRYEADRVALLGHCHCTVCRKATGAAFATWAHVEPECFRFLRGESLIEKYLDLEGMGREFCRVCGSPVPGRPVHGGNWSIPAGTLDEDPEVRPALHIFVRSRAPWWTIADELPRFETWPPGFEPPGARE
jgi:hypothetical protein